MSNLATHLPPPLREGDRLTGAEFLRRWEAMPELKQAELIDGVVFCMSSPVSMSHGTVHPAMSFWLSLYAEVPPGLEVGSDATWVMGPKDIPQPDLYLRILPECGGQSGVSGQYGSGAPELIVEVSGSSLSRDLGVKLELYRRMGVCEYLTVLLNSQRVIWRQLVRGRYRDIAVDEDGLLRSRVFPGLWLDPETLWSKKKSIRTAVERGLKSDDHAAFVKRLATGGKRVIKSPKNG